MTVANANNRKTYAGDSVTTSFATSPVVFFDTSDLEVFVTDSTGVAVQLVENTNYTVTGGNGSTGTVNLAGGSVPHGAVVTGSTLVILRDVPITQNVDLVNGDESDAEVLERALDRITMVEQQLQETLDRALTLAPGDTSGSDMELPSAALRAGLLLGFDDNGVLTLFIPETSVLAGLINGSAILPGTVTGGPGGSLANATIVGNNIAAATIVSNNIAAATIVGGNIASATITGGNIASATLTGGNIASGTITGTNIGTATITSSNIQDATITGSDIGSATITAGNIATGTITSTQIQDATITGNDIASATITGGNVASATLTGGNIASATVTGGNIASATVTGGNLASQTVTAGNITNLTITAAQIANLTITSGKVNTSLMSYNHDIVFSVGSATQVNWASGTLKTSDGTTYSIASGNTGTMSAKTYIYLDTAVSATVLQTTITLGTAVGDGRMLLAVAQNNTGEAVFQVFNGIGGLNLAGANIVAASITTNEIAAATITGGNIAAGTITAGNITANTITAAQIAASTITTNEIAANTITAADIAGGTITATQMATGTITAASGIINDINADTITSGSIRGINVNAASHTTKGSYLTSAPSGGATTLDVKNTADFAASGSGIIIDTTNDRDAFAYTGKTATTLTGCTGVLAHNNGATIIPLVKNIVIDAAINELRAYGDLGGGTGVEEIVAIGSSAGFSSPSGAFGSLATNSKVGVQGYSEANTAVAGQASGSGYGGSFVSATGIGLTASGNSTKGNLELANCNGSNFPSNKNNFQVAQVGSRLYYADGSHWYPLTMPYFESSDQTIVVDTDVSVAHGLTDGAGNNRTPKHVTAILRNTTAWLGYAVGDEVVVAATGNSSIQAAAGLYANATHVGFMISNSGFWLARRDGSSPSVQPITPSDWALVFRAS